MTRRKPPLPEDVQELGRRRKAALAEIEAVRQEIPAAARRAMQRRGINGERVAQELGMARQSLWRILNDSQEHGIEWFQRNVGTSPLKGQKG